MKLIIWLCILIVVVIVQYITVEPFDVRKPYITKKYTYAPLDIYPYDVLPIIEATSIDATFTVKSEKDIMATGRASDRKATIYTAIVINSVTDDDTIKFDRMRKIYNEFMNSRDKVLKIKIYKAPPATSEMYYAQAKTLNRSTYTKKAIRDVASIEAFINFTGVTDAMVRAWIAELFERALNTNTTVTRNGGMYVSVLIYNDIPDTVDSTFPPYYYVQRIINYPFIDV
jgi:hypothetical protein